MSIILSFVFFAFSLQTSGTYSTNPPDTIRTQKGTIVLHPFGHGSLMIEYRNVRVYIDPFSKVADYTKMPKADIILITHEHQDHLDPATIHLLSTAKTQIILNKSSRDVLGEGTAMSNGEIRNIGDIKIKAVPAYNTTPGRESMHPKGRDNGYVVTLVGKHIYIAGDTEDIPEMKNLGEIDIAFLPMNQPYTMTPEQVARAAQMVKPKILYPYHFGDTDVSKLTALLKGAKNIELRLRNMR
jgi:L-ascorbate metabolism protein UlaG (beta-lactamase superfamily)